MLGFGGGKKHEPSVEDKPTSLKLPRILSGSLLIKLISAQELIVPIQSNHSLPTPESQPTQFINPLKRRESVQRQKHQHLPYVIITFDRNEVVVDAISGSMSNPSYLYSCTFDVSTSSEIILSAFLRNGHLNTATGEEKKGHGQKRSIDGPDLFLASTSIVPNFDPRVPIDKIFESKDGSGSFRLQIIYKPSIEFGPLKMDDFELLKVIGKGTFGKVMQVRKKDTGRIYAIKSIKKAHIISRSEVTHTLAERSVMTKLVNGLFVVPLKFSFSSPTKLFLGMSYVAGGELFFHLQRETRFSEERSRFYAAELVCALESLHEIDVIYRDLKPENILLDLNGHIQLCDFGLVKNLMAGAETTNTFCGTPEYISPEIILGKGYSKTVDWWSFGILLFEMLSGLPPFYDVNHQKMYRRIISEEISFTRYVPRPARDLISNLLKKDSHTRLGVNGAATIKSHEFFASIDWKKLEMKEVQPPWRPSVESATDTSNHDEVFTKEAVTDSVVDTYLTESMQAKFEGFSFTNPTLGQSLR